MKKRKFLVVCRDNFSRSRLIEKYLNKKTIFAKSAGVGPLAYICGTHFKKDMDKEYDIILAADDPVTYKLIHKYGVPPKKIKNLKIINIYSRIIPFKIGKHYPIQALTPKLPRILKNII